MNMMSSEAKNFERFVDNYVAQPELAPVSSDSNYNWINMPYGEGNSLQNGQGFMNPMGDGQFPGNYPRIQSPIANGTEIWEERPIGNHWRAVALKTSLQDWQEFRPEVQSRPPQWSPPFQQQVPVQARPQTAQMPISTDSIPVYQEQPTAVPNSNQIQSLVCDLIRQNNMNKSFSLPPWVDVTKPPPPLPKLTQSHQAQMQFQAQVQPQAQNHSMVGTTPMQPVNAQQLSFGKKPDTFSTQDYSQLPMLIDSRQQQRFNAGGDHLPSFESITNSAVPQRSDVAPQPSSPAFQLSNSVPKSSQEQKSGFHNPLVQDKSKSSPNVSRKTSSEDEYAFNVEVEKNNTNLEKLNPNLPPLANFQGIVKTIAKANVEDNSAAGQRVETDFNNSNKVSSQLQREHSLDLKPSLANESNENIKIKPQENESSQLHRRRSYHRQPSAADLDMDWRKRDSEEDKRQVGGRGYRRTSNEVDSKNNNPRPNMRQNSGENDVFKSLPVKEAKPSQHTHPTKFNEAKKFGESLHIESGGQRHLTQMSKVKLLCLLQQNDEGSAEDSVGKEIRHLQISDSESDMSKFIEVTQFFATNEAKMREVAEMLCNKAINNPRYGRNVSVLCDRLSNMMVHGTKFRNVVLNVMQGHYKNRELLFSASFRQDKRWFGFVTFLIELFLNLRTATRERLQVLSGPVCNCLFQVLNSEKVDQKHLESIGHLFKVVGPVLESEYPSRLNELMQEIRDRCVLSKTAFVKSTLLHCVELYACKWERLAP